MAYILLLLLSLGTSLQSMFCRLFSDKNGCRDAVLSSVLFSSGYGLLVGVITLILAKFGFAPSKATLICGLTNAVLMWIYNLAMIKASRLGNYSVQMVFAFAGVIIGPMVYEVIVKGRVLGGAQYIGIALMLAALVLLNMNGLSFRGSSKKFLFWCLLLFIINAFYCSIMDYQQVLLNGRERNETIMLIFVASALFNIVYQLIKGPKPFVQAVKVMPPAAYGALAMAAVSASVSVHLSMYVLSLNQISATVMFALEIGIVLVLTILYSRLIFKERLSRPQIAGLAVSAAAIILLSL